jgi:hypothetical protein
VSHNKYGEITDVVEKSVDLSSNLVITGFCEYSGLGNAVSFVDRVGYQITFAQAGLSGRGYPTGRNLLKERALDASDDLNRYYNSWV